MGARITESALYGHLWGTDELRAVFDESARIQGWMDVLVALAGAQAELGIIPAEAARAIAGHAAADRLDMTSVIEDTRRTGHSMLGFIRGWQAILPAEGREWVYYGATVQDVTDTWTALAMKAVSAVVWRDLRRAEAMLLDLADHHRDTLMPGRTHAQAGSPITFGLKAASWADELRRHLVRLREGAPRWQVGQLGGAVGTLAFFGEHGVELRRRFCHRLDLGDPGLPWLTARDRVAEFVHLMAMIATTLARVGNEIYQLQRTEIGELVEPATAESVGSITMPHKRNPEVSEHLVTLARLVRIQADVVLEGMVQEHERDGRGWKAEWVALPEACLLSGTALHLVLGVLDGLRVDVDVMKAHLLDSRSLAVSEKVLASISPQMGKHRAQALLQGALADARSANVPMWDALAASEGLRKYLDPEMVESFRNEVDAGLAPAMVDQFVERVRGERAAEPDQWP